MPWIQTIGASTGVMVAMASPTSAPVPFNWARVLRHEFVHVITVQQTGFNIPHWFTEALAVLNEGYPPPSSWDKLLVERLAKGNLRTLETIDTGFQRPANSDDWQFTYCQSRLYAEYMLERGGSDALKKMLSAYREQASTPAAIKKVFGVATAEFEKGYRAFLERKVASLPKLESRPTKTVEQLEKEFEAKPGDPAVGGAYAWALLEAGNANLAKSTARHTLAKQPGEVWSSLVLARLEADEQQYGKAIGRLSPLLDRSAPQREVLLTLVKLKLLDEKPAEAAELAEIGIKHFPLQAEFLQGLTAAYAQLDDAPHLRGPSSNSARVRRTMSLRGGRWPNWRSGKSTSPRRSARRSRPCTSTCSTRKSTAHWARPISASTNRKRPWPNSRRRPNSNRKTTTWSWLWPKPSPRRAKKTRRRSISRPSSTATARTPKPVASSKR